jgi:RNA polymerase sigma-70 factor (ECF subfamily)
MDTERLVHEHKDLVYHVLWRMVRDREAHRDLFQEIFLNILRGLPDFRGEAKLSTWIYGVAVRTCLLHLRRIKNEPLTSLDERQERGTPEPSDAAALASSADPLSEVDRERALERALGGLPMKYKLPLTLFYLEGRSYREIAEILSVPLGTVKTHIYRGLREMRRKLGGELHDHL